MKTNIRRAATALAAGAAAALAASAVVAALATAGQSKISFRATQQDVPVDGEFKKFSANVDFDPAKPAAGRVDLAIDLASVATGSSDADELLKGKAFFDAAQFPQARFAAKTITATGAGSFQASGQFSLKGRSAPLRVPFTARPEGAGLRIEGSVPLSRLAYKVGEGEWADTGTLADQVQIRFSLYLPH
ncbi:MAG: YceI family protein [Rhodocyclaceae bacterium]|nr:YceI family protein [Rhodocyclaceae bacterium]